LISYCTADSDPPLQQMFFKKPSVFVLRNMLNTVTERRQNWEVLLLHLLSCSYKLYENLPLQFTRVNYAAFRFSDAAQYFIVLVSL